MKHSAVKVVRALDTLKGRKSTILNDATTFGRSIKVWGWTATDYADAAWHLIDMGYKVKVVRTRKLNHTWSQGNNLRLHVSA